MHWAIPLLTLVPSTSWLTGPWRSQAQFDCWSVMCVVVVVVSRCPFLEPSFTIWLDLGDVIFGLCITVIRLLRLLGQCQSDVDLLVFGVWGFENVFIALLSSSNIAIVGPKQKPTYSGWLRKFIVLLLLQMSPLKDIAICCMHLLCASFEDKRMIQEREHNKMD